MPGDIILGGLFPVHSSGAVKCMSLNPERGIQRLEAMLFTLDEINNNSALLPGLRLGANLRDTCSLGNHALEQSLDFVKTTVDDVMNDQKEVDRSQDIVRGVVGGSYTTVSILVANLYRLFKLPQISYASTSAVLSDKRTYPLFARTVPSDVEQARVMAALVAAHNWTYVSTVRSAGDYGDSGMDAFWKEADKRDVCIAAREVVRGSSTSKDFDEVVRVLRHGFSKARAVVLFTRMDHTTLLLDAVRRANYTDHFVFIGSDGWGRENIPVLNNSRVANGALTIEILATEIEKFSTYYKNLRWDNTRNPWFAKYWQSLFGCTFDNSSKPNDLKLCSETRDKRLGDKLPEPFKQEAKIQFVYDAVYALAHGLHNLQQKLCPFNPDPAKWDKNECIRKLLAYPGDKFYKTIISTAFKGRFSCIYIWTTSAEIHLQNRAPFRFF
uniref:ANF_receptor domain-containing protein n=1 Tax=Mesocestoides corti TaxID=53468 RepID=A0A5K3FBH9_MESCO